MNTKYTPGPWHLDDPIHAHVLDDTYHVLDAGRGFTDDPAWCGFSLSGFMSNADAKLIAAAPDLAEALQGLLHALESAVHGQIDIRAAEARAALAKAGL